MVTVALSEVSNYNVAKALLAQDAFNVHQNPRDVRGTLEQAITATEPYAIQVQPIAENEPMTSSDLSRAQPARLADTIPKFT